MHSRIEVRVGRRPAPGGDHAADHDQRRARHRERPHRAGLQHPHRDPVPGCPGAPVRPRDRHDDREVCPDCNTCIAVVTHSGLPDARCILFTSHVKPEPGSRTETASFACSSCYKCFSDSYAFLDHVFQKQIGSDRSCLRLSNPDLDLHELEPSLLEQCFKNCLIRELKRSATEKTGKRQSAVQQKEIEIRLNSFGSATSW